MTKALSGVRADQKRSYRSLEKYACHVREHLKLAPLMPSTLSSCLKIWTKLASQSRMGVKSRFAVGLSRWRTLKDMRDTTDPKILLRCSRPNRRTSGLN